MILPVAQLPVSSAVPGCFCGLALRDGGRVDCVVRAGDACVPYRQADSAEEEGKAPHSQWPVGYPRPHSAADNCDQPLGEHRLPNLPLAVEP